MAEGRLAGRDLAALAVASSFLISEGARGALIREDQMCHMTYMASVRRIRAEQARELKEP